MNILTVRTDTVRPAISRDRVHPVLVFALINTLTTFNLAPRVLKVYRGEEPVPEAARPWLSFPVGDGAVRALADRLVAWLRAPADNG